MFFSFIAFLPREANATDKLENRQSLEKVDDGTTHFQDLNGDNVLGAAKKKPIFKSIVEDFPPLVRFMVGITILLLAPSLSRMCKLPDVVGLIIAGVLFGPFALGLMHREGVIISLGSCKLNLN